MQVFSQQCNRWCEGRVDELDGDLVVVSYVLPNNAGLCRKTVSHASPTIRPRRDGSDYRADERSRASSRARHAEREKATQRLRPGDTVYLKCHANLQHKPLGTVISLVDGDTDAVVTFKTGTSMFACRDLVVAEADSEGGGNADADAGQLGSRTSSGVDPRAGSAGHFVAPPAGTRSPIVARQEHVARQSLSHHHVQQRRATDSRKSRSSASSANAASRRYGKKNYAAEFPFLDASGTMQEVLGLQPGINTEDCEPDNVHAAAAVPVLDEDGKEVLGGEYLESDYDLYQPIQDGESYFSASEESGGSQFIGRGHYTDDEGDYFDDDDDGDRRRARERRHRHHAHSRHRHHKNHHGHHHQYARRRNQGHRRQHRRHGQHHENRLRSSHKHGRDGSLFEESPAIESVSSQAQQRFVLDNVYTLASDRPGKYVVGECYHFPGFGSGLVVQLLPLEKAIRARLLKHDTPPPSATTDTHSSRSFKDYGIRSDASSSSSPSSSETEEDSGLSKHSTRHRRPGYSKPTNSSMQRVQQSDSKPRSAAQASRPLRPTHGSGKSSFDADDAELEAAQAAAAASKHGFDDFCKDIIGDEAFQVLRSLFMQALHRTGRNQASVTRSGVSPVHRITIEQAHAALVGYVGREFPLRAVIRIAREGHMVSRGGAVSFPQFVRLSRVLERAAAAAQQGEARRASRNQQRFHQQQEAAAAVRNLNSSIQMGTPSAEKSATPVDWAKPRNTRAAELRAKAARDKMRAASIVQPTGYSDPKPRHRQNPRSKSQQSSHARSQGAHKPKHRRPKESSASARKPALKSQPAPAPAETALSLAERILRDPLIQKMRAMDLSDDTSEDSSTVNVTPATTAGGNDDAGTRRPVKGTLRLL